MKGMKENTLTDWIKGTAGLLKPLYDTLKRELFTTTDYIQSDETTVLVMYKDKHRAAKEYLWMIRGPLTGLVLFYYDKGSRGGYVIRDLISEYNYNGYLQCDGFEGYEAAFRGNPAGRLVNCMAHIRRRFEQALTENRKAEYVMSQIQLLYSVERVCDDKKLTADECKSKRQELSRPVINSLKKWMETEGVKYSPGSLVGKATAYAYTHWDNMMRYLCKTLEQWNK